MAPTGSHSVKALKLSLPCFTLTGEQLFPNLFCQPLLVATRFTRDDLELLSFLYLVFKLS